MTSLSLAEGRESFQEKRVTCKGGVRCERFNGTLSVVLKFTGVLQNLGGGAKGVFWG